MNTHTPVISFLRRYWWIALIIIACVWLVFSPGAFRLLDLFVYLPCAFGITVGLPLLWRNIFHSKTTDADVDSGDYTRFYRQLDTRTRCLIVTFQWMGYVIASAIIVAGFLIFLSGLPVAP
jgi:hypothetical protein